MDKSSETIPRVYVSVLNWNNYAMTIQCLESLQSLDYPNYRIIVVDNASSDNSVAEIQSRFPDVTILTSDKNLGYAHGNQLALNYAMEDPLAKIFWILNNDTTTKPDVLSLLVNAYQQHGEALYGGVPGRFDAKLNEFVVTMRLWNGSKSTMLRNVPISTCFPTQETHRVEVLSGSHLLVPISIIRQYGFIDNSYFLYSEDVDYCLRLKKHGINCFLVPKSQIIHYDGGSHKVTNPAKLKPIIRYYRARNQIILYQRYFSNTRYISIIFLEMFYAFAWFGKSFLEGRVALNCAYFTILGIRDALMQHMGKTFAPEDAVTASTQSNT